jgi:putative transposase
MDEYESLSHSKWECKYHVVVIPKCRRKVLYWSLRLNLGEVFRKLAEQKESRIEEGHLQADHVHMMISEALWASMGQRAPASVALMAFMTTCIL